MKINKRQRCYSIKNLERKTCDRPSTTFKNFYYIFIFLSSLTNMMFGNFLITSFFHYIENSSGRKDE